MAPKEHGSWSLAFEPLALSLLVAPSRAGAGLALALAAAFFARRPLRLLMLERRAERRSVALRALALCGAAGLAGLAAALAMGGSDWLAWLAPSAIAGAAFVYFDVRGEGRAELAELAGATAFAATPIAFAVLGGMNATSAVALGALMVGRAAPSVATVRAMLRAVKTGVRHDGLALTATAAALVLSVWLASRGFAPLTGAVAMGVFMVRALALLVFARPAWRGRTIGMLEATLGLLFIASVATAWN